MGEIARFERRHHRPIDEGEFAAMFEKPEGMPQATWDVIQAEREAKAAAGRVWDEETRRRPGTPTTEVSVIRPASEDLVESPHLEAMGPAFYADAGDVGGAVIKEAIQARFETGP